MVKVGIIGVGTVGQSVEQILRDNQDVISARAGEHISVTTGVVRSLDKARDVECKLTTDIDDVLNDETIDIVVELMGGVEEPYSVVKRALEKGKAVVTANKALLAYHRYELQEVAGSVPFEFEASVAGGIPIINALREGLSANHIESIKGIMNGTCNYMMTKMMNEGVQFDAILKESQELGYAEADPTFDIGGFDAAHKLLILASIAYGIDAKPEDILIEGIEKVTQDDIAFAKEFGYVIKLLAIANKEGNEIELKVHPALIPADQMIAKIDGVMNAVSVVGDKVGETLYYGPGAGGDATASAVIANIVDIVRSAKRSPMLGYKRTLEEGLVLRRQAIMSSEYYMRIPVVDKPGVLAKIADILGRQDISIASMLQKSLEDGTANILLSTHESNEASIAEAMRQMAELEQVVSEPVMIRIER
jgi:homoserine dehydrogenase